MKIIFFSSNIYFVHVLIFEFERKHTSIKKIIEKEENVIEKILLTKKSQFSCQSVRLGQRIDIEELLVFHVIEKSRLGLKKILFF